MLQTWLLASDSADSTGNEPGGFVDHCPNLEQEFDAIEPVAKEGATAFPITRNKDGIWGFKTEVISLALPVEGCKADWIESKRN